MHTLDELVDLVIASGLAVEAECYVGRRQPLPVRCMTLYATPGEPPLRSFQTTTERPRVQFTFRDARYPDAEAWAVTVWKLCESVENRTLGGVEYLYIEPFGSVAGMGEDDNNHPIVGFNVRIARVIMPGV